MHAADPISTFNQQLADAKLAALGMLRHLMNTVAAFNAEDHPQTSNWPGRELRLIAATILRTKPLATESTTPCPQAPPPEAPPTVDRASGPEKGAPKHQAPAPPAAPPKLRSRLNPVAIRARRDIRNLVRDGVLPPSFLEGIGPPPSSGSPLRTTRARGILEPPPPRISTRAPPELLNR